MNSPRFMLGIDPHPDHCLAVRVRVDSLRPEITDTIVIDNSSTPDPDSCRNTEAAVAIPDDRVIVKYLALAEHGPDDRERALFELTQSLTGPEHDYLMDIVPTGLDKLFLGLALRRELLADTMILPYKGLLGTIDPEFALPRGLALAHGYLTYCVPAANSLVVLLDLGLRLSSIAIVYNRHVVALAHLAIADLDLAVDTDRERFAVELKTLVNFRLATLFGYGLTLPPAALVISGEPLTDPLQTTLQRYFSMPILPPEINTGFLGDHLRQDPADIRRFLAPLGLTAKRLA